MKTRFNTAMILLSMFCPERLSDFTFFGYNQLRTLIMTDDVALLRRYAAEGSEAAFTELVERYLPLVYSAALRQVGGDRSAAEDVAQHVFIELARCAGKLSPQV